MRMATGKVVEGKVVVEGTPLDEGAKVMVLAMEGDETFQLSAEDEESLLVAIAELERGEYVDGQELLKSLPGR